MNFLHPRIPPLPVFAQHVCNLLLLLLDAINIIAGLRASIICIIMVPRSICNLPNHWCQRKSKLGTILQADADAADAALCNNCIPSIAMGDGTAERAIARMNESSGEDKARRFDGGEDGGSATLKGRVEDMSKVTCIPLLAVAVIDDAGIPQRPEAEFMGGGAMSINNQWLQP